MKLAGCDYDVTPQTIAESYTDDEQDHAELVDWIERYAAAAVEADRQTARGTVFPDERGERLSAFLTWLDDAEHEGARAVEVTAAALLAADLRELWDAHERLAEKCAALTTVHRQNLKLITERDSLRKELQEHEQRFYRCKTRQPAALDRSGPLAELLLVIVTCLLVWRWLAYMIDGGCR